MLERGIKQLPAVLAKRLDKKRALSALRQASTTKQRIANATKVLKSKRPEPDSKKSNSPAGSGDEISSLSQENGIVKFNLTSLVKPQ